MNNALSRVSTWAHENELTLNPSKSVALFITNGRFDRTNLQEIVLNKKTLPPQQNAIDLGFSIDSKLSFSNHIDRISGQIYAILRHLWTNGKFLSAEIRRR
jgi:hypothetical protein